MIYEHIIISEYMLNGRLLNNRLLLFFGSYYSRGLPLLTQVSNRVKARSQAGETVCCCVVYAVCGDG